MHTYIDMYSNLAVDVEIENVCNAKVLQTFNSRVWSGVLNRDLFVETSITISFEMSKTDNTKAFVSIHIFIFIRFWYQLLVSYICRFYIGAHQYNQFSLFCG